jgi:hypothetical protein
MRVGFGTHGNLKIFETLETSKVFLSTPFKAEYSLENQKYLPKGV